MDSTHSWAIRVTHEIGRQIRTARNRAGLTSEQLAVRCTEIGLPMKQPVIANLEAGRRNTVAVPELLAIAAVLDVPPVTLLAPLETPAAPAPAPGPALAPAIDVIEWAAGREPIVEPHDEDHQARSWIALRELRQLGSVLTLLVGHVDYWHNIDKNKRADVAYVLRLIAGRVTEIMKSLERLRTLDVDLDAADLPLPDLAPIFEHLTPIEIDRLQDEDHALDWHAAVQSLRDDWAQITSEQ